MKMYIDGLGYRNAKTESEQIIWFIRQKIKPMRANVRTAYLLKIRDCYFDKLIKSDCYEILAFLRDSISDKQVANREKRRKKWAQKLEKIEQEQMALHARIKAKNRLIAQICYN